MDIQLSEALAQDITLNLVAGEASTATYGSSNDWTISVGSATCNAVTEDNCQVTIAVGETSPSDDITITIIADGRTNESPETIILSMVIDSPGDIPDLMLGNSNLSFTIPADLPLPSVSLSADNTSITEGNTATITLTLSEPLGSNATFNLIEGGTGATYGTSNDWNLSVGGTDCSMASRTNPCQVTISQGQRTAETTVEVRDDMTEEAREEFSVSLDVDSGSTSLVTTGSSSSLNFTIQDTLATVSLVYSGSTTIGESQDVTMNIMLSKAVAEEVRINIISEGSTAAYGGGTGMFMFSRDFGAGDCQSASGTGCQAIFSAGRTNPGRPGNSNSFQVLPLAVPVGQMIVVSIIVDPGSEHLVSLGDTSTHTLTIQ